MRAPPPRPFLTLKIAQTIDGRIATATGSSRWVTGPASRAVGHALRADHDAILVGVGTVVADNPRLTVRLAEGENPVRVVLDSTLRIPLTADVLKTDDAATIVITTADASQERAREIENLGARVMRVANSPEGLDLERALEQLNALGLRSVLVEGGARVATSLFQRRLLDRVVMFIAPKIIGAGIETIGDLGIVNMDDAITFEPSSIEVGEDGIVFDGRPHWP